MGMKHRAARGWGTLAAVLLMAGGRPPQAALLGDVDGDGHVTVADAQRLLRIAAGRARPTSRDLLLGDVWPLAAVGPEAARHWNVGDGRLTVDDAAEVLRVALGLAAPQEVGPVVYCVAGTGPRELQDPRLSKDGPAEATLLADPWDLAVGRRGEVYFTENFGNRVRALQPDGTIRTLAGRADEGFADGPGDSARFNQPCGIALAPDGSLIVADSRNAAIRRVARDGRVTTLAGGLNSGHADGRGSDAEFNGPTGVAVDAAGNVYVADTGNSQIRKVTPSGVVTTVAGDGHWGMKDGPALHARLNDPSGVAVDPRDGSVYVADTGNNAIRKLTPGGYLVTVAGTGKPGHVDGPAASARFFGPYGLDVDREGRVWIADWYNQSIRLLSPDGRVSTVAGRLPAGSQDGPAALARFHGLMNVRAAPDGRLYVADTDNERIRVVVP